jgi:hypothetical protein
MKTILICSDRKMNNHVGEYYDEIIEVPHQPVFQDPSRGTDTHDEGRYIQPYFDKIQRAILSLWEKDKGDCDEPIVSVWLDAASPFNAMLIDLKVVLNDSKGIVIELPYLESTERKSADPKVQATLDQLER